MQGSKKNQVARPARLKALQTALRGNPVCALLGPRQCGKTTLALMLASKRARAEVFDLESAVARARLVDLELTLGPLRGLVIIDEVQRLPALYETLRPLADRPRIPARFLLLGSASADLVRDVSETLAGRIAFVDLGGFDLTEVGARAWRRLWLRGGFPRSYLARGDTASTAWRGDFIRTFLERDLPQLGVRLPAETLRRFWTMLAHYHAQIWNGAELARAFGVNEHTVRRYLDILAGAYMVRALPPWHENVGKRQYRSPKIYVRDSGLFHALLAIGSNAELESHPKLGASWEGFALEQTLSLVGSRDAYFWGTHAGAELDLLLLRRGRRYGVEFKLTSAPTMTRSLHSALADLGLERAWIVYPGPRTYPVHRQVDAVAITDLPQHLGFLAG